MQKDRVAAILDSNFKSGVSQKTQKPWTMRKIKTDGGKEATTFDDVMVGEEVLLKYNEEYKNYSAARLTQDKREELAVQQKLDYIIQMLETLTGAKEAAKPSAEEIAAQVGGTVAEEEPLPEPQPGLDI